MHVRAAHTLPDLRLALLTGVSALALCLSAHAAHAQSITIEEEGDWVRPIGDDVIYAEYLDVIANTAVNQSIARGNDFGGRGQAIIQFNSWFSISGGGGRAMLENSGAAPHADLFLVNQTYLYPQIVTVPDFVTTGCPPNQQACEQIYQDGKATLRSEIDFYDFDAGADVGIGTKGKARFFAGVRYVKFDETLSTTFTNSQNTAYYRNQKLTSERDSSFTGWGPRVGFTADVQIGNSGFSFGGTAAFAALFGDIDTSITSRHTTSFNAAPTSTNNTFTQSRLNGTTAYSFELAPQISYSFGGEYFSGRISGGYRFDQYLAIVDTATRQTYAQVFTGGDVSDDAKFNGPFVRVGIKIGKDADVGLERK